MQDMAQQTRDARDEKWPRCVGWELGKLGGWPIDVTRQRAGAECRVILPIDRALKMATTGTSLSNSGI